MQELRETTTYASILRAIGSGEKESGQIASKCKMEVKNIFPYLRKLQDLEILSITENLLSAKKSGNRYRILINRA